ncbi:MAG: hypothetical protein ACAH83_04870 [Alphaproteobacteria bacterium]
MRTDDKFMEQISRLKSDKPSEELYQRIITVVPHLAQAGVDMPANKTWLERFFGEWNYALRLKVASFAMLAVFGFCVGHLKGPSAHQDSFFSAIITGDIGWEN